MLRLDLLCGAVYFLKKYMDGVNDYIRVYINVVFIRYNRWPPLTYFDYHANILFNEN